MAKKHMKFLLKASALITALLITGCATGEKFTSPKLGDPKNSIVYLMRKSQYLGALICRDVALDGKTVGCIQNGGFLRLEVTAGPHTISVLKASRSDWANETSIDQNYEAGTIHYYEWTNSLNHLSVVPLGGNAIINGQAGAALVRHDPESAASMLKELRNSGD